MMNYKKHIKSALVIVLVATFILPSISLAEANKPERPDKPMLVAKGGFCSKILGDIDEKRTQFVEKKVAIEAKRGEREDKLAARHEERRAKHTENRSKWDANRQAHFDKLMELADTDVKKEAVAAFQATVAEAISAERTAFDNAVDTFNIGVKDLWRSKKADYADSIEEYRVMVEQAVATAKEGCDLENPDVKALSAAFRDAIKEAKDSFKVDRDIMESIKDEIKALHETKKETMGQAVEDFRATMEQARTDLKAVLKPEADGDDDSDDDDDGDDEETPEPTESPEPTETPSE